MSTLAFFYLLTAVIGVAAALWAYTHSRDAMHPAVFIGPLMAYGYGLWPLILNREGGLLEYFHPEQLEQVAFLYFGGLFLFFVAMVWFRVHPGKSTASARAWAETLQEPATRQKLFLGSVVLGLVAVTGYWYMIENVGGFVRAYSQQKGGGWTESGFIGESILLSYPAVLLLALSRLKQRIRPVDILLALAYASPHLLQGTFGGRRGPLFLSLAVLFVAWFLARGRSPRLRTGLVGVSLMLVAVVVVWSQRRAVYLGSEGSFEISRVFNVISPPQVVRSNEYVSGVAAVLTADHHERYYWGHRYFVTFLVRPIPKQIWPSKYDDMNAVWVDPSRGEERQLYREAVGFSLVQGASVGLVADLYMEFAGGLLLALIFLGCLYGWLWKQHRSKSGVWSLLYMELIILSIYLPVQSFSAVMYRFLLMGSVTIIVWRLWLHSAEPRPAVQVRYP